MYQCVSAPGEAKSRNSDRQGQDVPAALRRIAGRISGPATPDLLMRDMDPFTGIVTGAVVCLVFWLAVLLFYWL